MTAERRSITSTPVGATTRPSVPATEPTDLLAPAEGGAMPALLRRAAWGAIIAGAVVAVVFQLWFNLLGLAIGLAVVSPAEGLGGFGVGTAIWVILASVLSLFAGGWLAARLSGLPRRLDGVLHAVVVWGVATLFGLWIITAGIGTAVAGTASALGAVAGAIGPAAEAAIESMGEEGLPAGIEQELQQLRDNGEIDPQVRSGVLGLIRGEATPREQQALADTLAERTDMSQAEAERRVQEWNQRADEMRTEIAEGAEAATDALSAVAFLGVFAMLFGLGGAALGGSVAYSGGRQRRLEHRTTPSERPPVARP